MNEDQAAQAREAALAQLRAQTPGGIRAKTSAWRAEQLMKVGISWETACILAVQPDIEYRHVLDMIEQGATEEQLLRILT